MVEEQMQPRISRDEQWDPSNMPPRLTPSPEPEIDLEDNLHALTPPLRQSIYPHPHSTTWHVNVVRYSPDWPAQYANIAAHLYNLLTTSTPPAPHETIEHIGITAIPGLAAKPNIDVLVTFSSEANLQLAVDALNWEVPTTPPFAAYTQIPRGGGIPGRESFKIYLPDYSPYYTTSLERSVYLIADIEENWQGRVLIRCYRTLKVVLSDPRNKDLLDEYASVKISLAKQAFSNCLEYAALKDDVVRKILLRGGWTENEVDVKERLTRRDYVVDAEDAY